MAATAFRHRFSKMLLPMFCIGVLAYLAYHVFEGERGMKIWWAVDARIVKAEEEHAQKRIERERLEARVRLLREDTLDRDMLEERLRAMLNLARPDEIIIMFKTPLDRLPARSAEREAPPAAKR